MDIIIVGGGIQGAGIAREASLRGLNVVLFEKGDFASGTSGKTSGLIHGGLRYLEQGEIRLVREAVCERYTLAHLAPHLVTPVPFLFPIYRGGPRKKITIQIGTLLYDLLSGTKSFGRTRFLSPQTVGQIEPGLASEGLLGAARFFDCQMDDARLCLSVLLSAQSQGATIFNYAEVTNLLYRHDRIRGVTVREGGKDYNIYGTTVINAAGPWSNILCAMDAGVPQTKQIRPTKGIHMVLPKITERHALVLSSATSRRIFFVLPWGEYSLIGTTDTDYTGDLDHVVPTQEEIAELISETSLFFPSIIREEVLGCFAALRPLLDEGAGNPWERSRREEIVWTPGGMLVVLGGKYTLFRKIAIRVIDTFLKRHWYKDVVKRPDACFPFHGGETGPIEEYRNAEIAQNRFPPALLYYLIRAYGTNYKAVLEMAGDPVLEKPLTPLGYPLAGEVIYAVRHEYARHLSDFMLRRTRLGHGPYKTDRSVIRTVSELMGRELAWNAEEIQHEQDAYLSDVTYS